MRQRSLANGPMIADVTRLSHRQQQQREKGQRARKRKRKKLASHLHRARARARACSSGKAFRSRRRYQKFHFAATRLIHDASCSGIFEAPSFNNFRDKSNRAQNVIHWPVSRASASSAQVFPRFSSSRSLGRGCREEKGRREGIVATRRKICILSADADATNVAN